MSNASQQAEFPREFVDCLCCPADSGPLKLSDAVCNSRGNILSATLTCEACEADYRIVEGIVRFLPASLSEKDEFEMTVRNEQYFEAGELSPCSRSPLSDHIELPPFLRELEIDDRSVVFEVGAGDGRFTLLMLQRGAKVLAVDISLNGLRKLNQRLASGRAPTPFPQDEARIVDYRGKVGLIHSDASKVRLTKGSVNRALSTTPLDTAEQRNALYRTISNALTDDGWFIGSVEYDDIWRRFLGLPLGRLYAEGIFIEHFSTDKVRRETAPFFETLASWPIRPRVPLVHRIPLTPGVGLSNLISRLPILREMGEILLFRAERPIREVREGEHRQGSFLVKTVFRWFVRLAKRQSKWHGELVKLGSD